MSAPSPKVLHPMAAFGHVRGLFKRIRIDRLEDRLDPLVPFPHKHDFYHLLFITEGQGWHEIDFRRHPAHAATFFLMKPAQVHSWQLSGDSKGYIIEFEESAFHAGELRSLKTILNSSADFYQTSRSDSMLRGICEFMLSEYTANQPGFEIILQSGLNQILILLHRLDSGNAPQPQDKKDILTQFRQLVEKHYKEEHEVRFYADALNLSSKALTMRITRASGQSARELIQERCLLESKRLLAYSEAGIAEIAESCGFPDANYFSRFFKKKVGRSPGAFRDISRRLC